MKRVQSLPATLAPRGLRRVEAAAYIGISTFLFDEMVADGRMPAAKLINSCRIWDRFKVDMAFADLPGDEENEASGILEAFRNM